MRIRLERLLQTAATYDALLSKLRSYHLAPLLIGIDIAAPAFRGVRHRSGSCIWLTAVLLERVACDIAWVDT